MAILSKKNSSTTVASGGVYSKISDTVFGSRQMRINMNRECFSNDYIYSYKEEENDHVSDDKEIGINKEYSVIHDEDWCDTKKNARKGRSRRYEGFHLSPEIKRLIYGDR